VVTDGWVIAGVAPVMRKLGAERVSAPPVVKPVALSVPPRERLPVGRLIASLGVAAASVMAPPAPPEVLPFCVMAPPAEVSITLPKPSVRLFTEPRLTGPPLMKAWVKVTSGVSIRLVHSPAVLMLVPAASTVSPVALARGGGLACSMVNWLPPAL